METICANGGGINWTWFHWFEFERTEPGRAIGRQVKADRFHNSDERQGADSHPQTDWRIYHSAAAPSGWQLTDSDPDFWRVGWEKNCATQKLDPAATKSFWVVRNKTEQLLIVEMK